MKKINKIFKFLLIAIATTLITSACNSNSSDDPYAISSDVTVLGFSLKKDISILSGIDSVFFSIDLQKGLIFNADSLPKGTDITRLIPIISYPSTVMSATITMSDGSYKTGSIDYKNNPSDSIDFSGKVILTLIAQDGFSTKTIKSRSMFTTWNRIHLRGIKSLYLNYPLEWQNQEINAQLCLEMKSFR